MFAQAVVMTRELPPETHALLHCAGVELPTEPARQPIQSANGGGHVITGELRTGDFRPATTEHQTASRVRRHRRSGRSS